MALRTSSSVIAGCVGSGSGSTVRYGRAAAFVVFGFALHPHIAASSTGAIRVKMPLVRRFIVLLPSIFSLSSIFKMEVAVGKLSLERGGCVGNWHKLQ